MVGQSDYYRGDPPPSAAGSPNPSGDTPQVAAGSYIDPTASLIGRVEVAPGCFVGPHAVLRSDEKADTGSVGLVRIGAGTNVQDGVVVHALAGSNVNIGEDSSLAHGAIVHGPCAVGTGVFVGFGAVVFGATVGSGSLVGHRAVVSGVEIPPGHAVPAGKVVTTDEDVAGLEPVGDDERAFMSEVSAMNRELAEGYRGGAAADDPARPPETDLSPYRFLEERALSFGADAASLLPAGEIVVDERVRLKCAVPMCQGYGHYLQCPPNVMGVEEFRSVRALYSVALVVQVESARDSSDLDDEGLAGKKVSELEEELHGDPNRLLGTIIGRLEAEAFKAGLHYAAGFTGGICILCPDCVGVGTGEPCRYPFEARPAMEGVGIDVVKTAAAAGLPMSLSSGDLVRWTGVVLVD